MLDQDCSSDQVKLLLEFLHFPGEQRREERAVVVVLDFFMLYHSIFSYHVCYETNQILELKSNKHFNFRHVTRMNPTSKQLWCYRLVSWRQTFSSWNENRSIHFFSFPD